ncbi:MAG: type II toxin-antitoxin system HicB family antitoxin, partial [Psychrobacter sp.]
MANKQYFSYKGYTGSIEVSTEDLCLFGKIQMIQDLVMYDGENLEELKLSFESAVDEYLEMCAEENKCPDKPCSGTFNVRMSESMHRKSIHESNILGITLNSFISK